MSIVITNITGFGQGEAEEISLASVTLAAGDTLLVATATDSDGFQVGPAWGGVYLTQDATQNAGANVLTIWRLSSPTPGTSDITATLVNLGIMSAVKVSGLSATPLDKTPSATGTGTAPNSGSTGTLSQADEAIYGAICTNGPNTDTAGTWDSPLANIMRAGDVYGSYFCLHTGKAVVAATTAVAAGKTGCTSRVWGAVCATYKAPAPPTEAPTMDMEAEMPTATSAVGSGSSAGSPLDMEAEMPLAVSAPGGGGSAFGPMEMESESLSGSPVRVRSDPTAIVTQMKKTMRASVPAGCGNGSMIPFEGMPTVELNAGNADPDGGTIECGPSAMEEYVPPVGMGPISHIVIHACCWSELPEGGISDEDFENPRFKYTVDGVTGEVAFTNDGGS